MKSRRDLLAVAFVALIAIAVAAGCGPKSALGPHANITASSATAAQVAAATTPLTGPTVPVTTPKLVPSTSTPATKTATTPLHTTTGTGQALLSASGTGTTTTAKFTTPGNNWNLDWTYNCAKIAGQGNFQINIYKSDGTPSAAGLVNQLGAGGTAIEQYHTGGTLYLKISSNCPWTIKALAS